MDFNLQVVWNTFKEKFEKALQKTSQIIAPFYAICTLENMIDRGSIPD